MTENQTATPDSPETSEEHLLGIQQVLQRVPVSRSTIYDWIARGLFPAPFKIGPRRVAWTPRMVSEWIAEKVQRP